MAGELMRMPEVTNGFSGSLGMLFLFVVMWARPRIASASFAGDLLGTQIDKEDVVLGAARRRPAGRVLRRAPVPSHVHWR